MPYGVRILLVCLWVARYEGRGFRTLSFPKGDAVLALRGMAVGLVVTGAVVALVAAFGGVTERTTQPGFSGVSALAGTLISWSDGRCRARPRRSSTAGSPCRPWLATAYGSASQAQRRSSFSAPGGVGEPVGRVQPLPRRCHVRPMYCVRAACGAPAGCTPCPTGYRTACSGSPWQRPGDPRGIAVRLQTRGNPLLTGGELRDRGELAGTVVVLASSRSCSRCPTAIADRTPTGDVEPTA